MPAERVAMRILDETPDVIEVPAGPEDASLDWIRSVCPYCGVGCGLLVGVRDGRVEKVRGDAAHPANLGWLCAKGVTLPQMLRAPDRHLVPLVRDARGAPYRRVSWDEALGRVAEAWTRIIGDHGPDAVAFYISGQLLTEDYYVVNKLAKGFLGTNNVDSNSRLCMASAVSGYVTSLGADAPPGCFADIELADCFFLVGSNTHACHPVTFERIRRRKAQAPRRVKVIVADPRRTRTASIADVFLPVRPGSDVALFNAMLHVLVEERLTDVEFIRDRTNGWPEAEAVARRWPPERAAEACGVPAADVREAARAFGRARAAMSFWAMGLNQSVHGTAKVNALINLHLATGQIGRPGAGPFSLTGQPNAMGGRETGGLAHLLPGHRTVTDPEHRREVEALWGVPPGRIAAGPGLAAVELFEAVAAGKVRSVWIVATNPMVSMPNLSRTRAALARAELVVASDAYHPTETTVMADVVLPAAQWSERDGTVTNSERAISLLDRATPPPGEALPDWEIFCRFAARMGYAEAFAFRSARDVYDEWRRFTVGRDLDIGGVDYDRLRRGAIHWPCPTGTHRPALRRYTDGRFAHPDGRARFLAHEAQPPAEPTDDAYPMILTTGRVRDQWHTMTRTGKIPSLLTRDPEPFVELHPDDAAALGVADGDPVEVASRRGAARANARVTETIRRGTCFMPFHWGALWGGAVVNQVTLEACDPVSRQPELKHCAVRVTKVPASRRTA
jgi:anaerobic selenocysteine-containing dehydrogenase